MSLQFPIPLFVGQAVRYAGQSWVWDGTGWHIDDVASRLDLATIPAYLGQFVYKMPGVPPVPTFISLGTPDIYGASFVLSSVAPFEGVKVYRNGELLVLDDGSGLLGNYVVNRAANRIEFITALAINDTITIGVLTPSDRIAPGRINIEDIKDLDTDWVTNPSSPTTGMVDGVRRTFDLLIDVPGVGQQFAVVAKASDLAVFIGGARQRPEIDYTVTGAELTMTVAPVAGVPFWALWYQPAGSGGGAGVSPPQPPLDARTNFYGWRPGTGLGWEDARGLAITVATAAARTALRADIDILPGTLVLQADTQELWRWTGSAWVRYLDSGTFTARLGGRMQSLRSTTALQRPAAASLLPGELWVNQADRVFGFGDAAGDPIEFLTRVSSSAGAADAGKLPALNNNGLLDQTFFNVGMRNLGTQNPGAIVVTNWNVAHQDGTAPVRAAAGASNAPPGPSIPYAGHYVAMGDNQTGVLFVGSPNGDTVYFRARALGTWSAWIQVNSPGLDISSAMLRANNLGDVNSKPTSRTNLEVVHRAVTAYAGDLDALAETGIYPLAVGVTNGWTANGTGTGGEATVGDAVLHINTEGSLGFQLGFNLLPAAPAAKPLRLRFKTGPATWTPWASILTEADVAAAFLPLAGGTLTGALAINPGADSLTTFAVAGATATTRLTIGQAAATSLIAAAAASGDTSLVLRTTKAGAQVSRVNIDQEGRASFSTDPAGLVALPTGAAFDFNSRLGGLVIPRMTSTQRDALGSAANGMIIYNTTIGALQVRAAGVWAAAGGNVAISDTAPGSPQPGQLWYKPSTPVGLYVWYEDGTSNQWVQIAGGQPALSGTQAINMTGLTEATFDPIPREANSFVVTLANVTTAVAADVLMNFVGDTGGNIGFGRQVHGAAYGPVVNVPASADLNFDGLANTGGLIGAYYFERQPVSTLDVWVFTGQHRRGSLNQVYLAGRAILSIPETRPRFRVSAGTFASNLISVTWRR